MTCIIGFTNGKEVHMVGDSGAFGTYTKAPRKNGKIFILKDKFLIGFAGSFRLGDLLRYEFIPPTHPEEISDNEYIVNYFVEVLRNLLKDKGFSCIDSNQDNVS